MYQSICLNFIITQWLKYQACKPKIMSLNLYETFVRIYRLQFLKIRIVHPNSAYRYAYLTCVLFMHYISHNKENFCWFEILFREVVSTFIKSLSLCVINMQCEKYSPLTAVAVWIDMERCEAWVEMAVPVHIKEK